jgi:hypothetical protein
MTQEKKPMQAFGIMLLYVQTTAADAVKAILCS